MNIRIAAATALFLALIPAQSNAASPMTNYGSLFKALQKSVSGEESPAAAPVILTQAGDMSFRVGQLEEQIRALNGRIEELSFQLLEMQEQMRRMQEDNEYRFQELEGGGRRGDAAPARQDDTDVAAMDSVTDSSDQERVEGTLGELTFDQDTLQGGEIDAPTNTDQTQTAALPETGREQLWNAAYGNILSGDYALAEQDFQRFIQDYPDSPKISDAYFWLGESQYAQGQYNVAARTLLTAHKQFPQSAKAPEMLLKLGMSLAALDNRDTACATYREVLLRYPKASDALKKKVAIEQGAMSC